MSWQEICSEFGGCGPHELNKRLAEEIASLRSALTESNFKLSQIYGAVHLQTLDEGIWAQPLGRPLTITEAYLQESLRDLHHVIEGTDPEAIERIKERLRP